MQSCKQHGSQLKQNLFYGLDVIRLYSIRVTPPLNSVRHRTHITAARRCLARVLGEGEEEADYQATEASSETEDDSVYDGAGQPSVCLLDSEDNHLIAAWHLKNALRHLGLVIGEVTSEDILDEIFSSFCVGK